MGKTSGMTRARREARGDGTSALLGADASGKAAVPDPSSDWVFLGESVLAAVLADDVDCVARLHVICDRANFPVWEMTFNVVLEQVPDGRKVKLKDVSIFLLAYFHEAEKTLGWLIDSTNEAASFKAYDCMAELAAFLAGTLERNKDKVLWNKKLVMAIDGVERIVRRVAEADAMDGGSSLDDLIDRMGGGSCSVAFELATRAKSAMSTRD